MHTKGELRKLRKLARKNNQPLCGELSVGNDPMEFSETAKGYQARYKWAKRYDELNGAPEGDWDR